jgi:hypothetical protein
MTVRPPTANAPDYDLKRCRRLYPGKDGQTRSRPSIAIGSPSQHGGRAAGSLGHQRNRPVIVRSWRGFAQACRHDGQNVVTMDTRRVQAELQALQRGRGVGRSRVRSWLGPGLSHLLDLSPDATDEELREQLITNLVDAVQALPTDLRFLFMVASGIESDEPLLKTRLSEASRVLDRDSRTLSRRLRQTEALLAGLLSQSASAESPYDAGGWTTSRVVLDIHLERELPLARVTQVVRSTRDGQAEFRHTVAIPLSAPTDQEVSVRAVAGCNLAALRRESDRSWVALFELPRPIARGRSHALAFEVEFPDRRCLLPYAVFAPVRPCASCEIRVSLGEPPAATTIWRADTVPPGIVTDLPARPRVVHPIDGVVSATFTGLRPGFAYGIVWRWAD